MSDKCVGWCQRVGRHSVQTPDFKNPTAPSLPPPLPLPLPLLLQTIRYAYPETSATLTDYDNADPLQFWRVREAAGPGCGGLGGAQGVRHGHLSGGARAGEVGHAEQALNWRPR